MQAVLAAMAAQSLLSASLSHYIALPPFSNSSPPPSLSSSFHGASLKLPRHSLSLAASAAPKPLAVVAATKKAVAVLKGTSNVEGVVTLTQEDDGLYTLPISFFIYLFLFFWIFNLIKS